MVHTVSRILRGRGGKRSFLVHFVASGEFDLPEFMRAVKKKYDPVATDNGKKYIQTIRMEVRPEELRSVIQMVPRGVQVAYEEQEPEKC